MRFPFPIPTHVARPFMHTQRTHSSSLFFPCVFLKSLSKGDEGEDESKSAMEMPTRPASDVSFVCGTQKGFVEALKRKIN